MVSVREHSTSFQIQQGPLVTKLYHQPNTDSKLSLFQIISLVGYLEVRKIQSIILLYNQTYIFLFYFNKFLAKNAKIEFVCKTTCHNTW